MLLGRKRRCFGKKKIEIDRRQEPPVGCRPGRQEPPVVAVAPPLLLWRPPTSNPRVAKPPALRRCSSSASAPLLSAPPQSASRSLLLLKSAGAPLSPLLKKSAGSLDLFI
ncbi:unnamed protein product [Linum trigynum]|uniref:Uncharacterized protein n=1 Tax=Linum trigynum TaxID=586398 RepID=A0AAV2GN23_9ROSI